jgi:hypothetical protein
MSLYWVNSVLPKYVPVGVKAKRYIPSAPPVQVVHDGSSVGDPGRTIDSPARNTILEVEPAERSPTVKFKLVLAQVGPTAVAEQADE